MFWEIFDSPPLRLEVIVIYCREFCDDPDHWFAAGYGKFLGSCLDVSAEGRIGIIGGTPGDAGVDRVHRAFILSLEWAGSGNLISSTLVQNCTLLFPLPHSSFPHPPRPLSFSIFATSSTTHTSHINGAITIDLGTSHSALYTTEWLPSPAACRRRKVEMCYFDWRWCGFGWVDDVDGSARWIQWFSSSGKMRKP